MLSAEREQLKQEIKKLVGESRRTLKDLEGAIKDLEQKIRIGGGASDTELSRWQQGHDVPTRDQLRILCAVLKVPQEQFGDLDKLRARAEWRLNADRASRPGPPVPGASRHGAAPPEQGGPAPEATSSLAGADPSTAVYQGAAAVGHQTQGRAGGRSPAQDSDQDIRTARGRAPLDHAPVEVTPRFRPTRVRLVLGAVLVTTVAAVGVLVGMLAVGKGRPPTQPTGPLGSPTTCHYWVAGDHVAVRRTPDPNAEVIKYKARGDRVIGPCSYHDNKGQGWTEVFLGTGGTAWMARDLLAGA